MFGKSMTLWHENKSNGMLLNSDGFATNLSMPRTGFALARSYDEIERLGLRILEASVAGLHLAGFVSTPSFGPPCASSMALG